MGISLRPLGNRLAAIRHSDGAVMYIDGSTESAGEQLTSALSGGREEEFLGVGQEPESHAAYLTLMVVQSCNMACTYCFAGDGSYGRRSVISEATIRDAINAKLERPGVSELGLTLFGGEPLLAFHRVQYAVEYALGAASLRGQDVHFGMTTNGSLVTPEIADYLAKHDFSVMVSIDGNKNHHDRRRRFVGGRSSWDAVSRGARLLLAKLGSNVIARVTVGDGMSDIEAQLGELAAIGFGEVILGNEGVSRSPIDGTVVSIGLSDRGVGRALAARDLEIAGRYLEEGLHVSDPVVADSIGPFIRKILSGERVLAPCGIGDTAVAVSTSGTQYACHHVVENGAFRMSDGQAKATLENLSRLIAEECAGCEAWSFCKGGCKAEVASRVSAGEPPLDDAACSRVRERLWLSVGSVLTHARQSDTPAVLDVRAMDVAYRKRRFARSFRGEAV